MLRQEKKVAGDAEEFQFYLSAFLTAGKSVRETLLYEQGQDRENGTVHKAWQKAWDDKLPCPEKKLIDFMGKDRDREVHTTGSRHIVGKEDREFPVGTHYEEDATITIAGPPGTPPAVLHKPTYSFTVDGIDRKVTEVCADYLKLLQRMIAEFKARAGVRD